MIELIQKDNLFPELSSSYPRPIKISATETGYNIFNTLPTEDQQQFRDGVRVGMSQYLMMVFTQPDSENQLPPKPISIKRTDEPILACAFGMEYTPDVEPRLKLSVILTTIDEINEAANQVFVGA